MVLAHTTSAETAAYIAKARHLRAEAATTFFADLAAWLIAPYRRYVERRDLMNELASLDDRALADIGINRDDIATVVATMVKNSGPANTNVQNAA